MDLVSLLEQTIGYPRYNAVILSSRHFNLVDNYFALSLDKALRTSNYETIQKCLIIIKSIIDNSSTRRVATIQAKRFTDVISKVIGWYRDYICVIKDGELASKTHARFNGNWKKPMIIIELQDIRQVVITEHTIDKNLL